VRRRKKQDNDSLDMLLDTISNTFGGILFLALLIAILVQFNESEILDQHVKSVTSEELAALRNTLNEKTATLRSLSQTLKTQQETLADFKPDPSSPLIDEILELRRNKNSLAQQRIELVTKLSQQGSVNTELDGELQDIDSRHELAQRNEAKLLEELQTEVRKRSRMARLPALRATSKREFAVVMRYGRLYFLHTSELDKQLGVLNYEDFVVLAEEKSTIRITPKPYAGFEVDDSENLDDLLKQKLFNLNSTELYLAVAVWEDSFTDFAHLRNALVELGWEYRLIPIGRYDGITESHTEAPLVQ